MISSAYTDSVLDLTKGTASIDNPFYGQNISNGVSVKFDVQKTSGNAAFF